MISQDAEERAREDIVLSFTTSLPLKIRNQFRDTGRLHALIIRATLDHGWTIPNLLKECTRGIGGNVLNPAGIVMHRLEWCAENPSAAPDSPHGVKRPFCSEECKDNGGFVLYPLDHVKAGLPKERCECRFRE